MLLAGDATWRVARRLDHMLPRLNAEAGSVEQNLAPNLSCRPSAHVASRPPVESTTLEVGQTTGHREVRLAIPPCWSSTSTNCRVSCPREKGGDRADW
jgi:hypothetical protein